MPPCRPSRGDIHRPERKQSGAIHALAPDSGGALQRSPASASSRYSPSVPQATATYIRRCLPPSPARREMYCTTAPVLLHAIAAWHHLASARTADLRYFVAAANSLTLCEETLRQKCVTLRRHRAAESVLSLGQTTSNTTRECSVAVGNYNIPPDLKRLTRVKFR